MNQTYKFSAYPTFSLHHQPLTTTDKNNHFGLPRRDYDFDNIMSALTSSYDRELAIYNFVVNLKSDLNIQSLNEMFDCLYMFAAPTSGDSFINWAQPGTYNCTFSGTVGTGAAQMNFRPNRGWYSAGLSTTAYINSNFNPFNINSNFNGLVGQNIFTVGGSFGIYLNNYLMNLAGDYYIMGAVTSTNGSPLIFGPRNGGSGFIYGCQSTGRFNLNSFNSPIQSYEGGLFSFVKQTNSLIEMYYNGGIFESKSNVTNNTVLTDSGPIIFGGTNLNATGTTVTPLNINSRSTNQFAFAYIGSNQIKPDILFRRLEEYLISINGSTYINLNQVS